MAIVYQTLHDFFRSLGLPLEQETDMTVHLLNGLHGNEPLASPVFRTNYYSFLLIIKGKGHYIIDNCQYDVGPHSFYFTNPGHLKSFNIKELLEGYMLTFSEKFVKAHFSGEFFTLFPFLVHETTPVMQLNGAVARELAVIFEQMLHEYQGNSLYKNAILTKHLAILLYKTKELLQHRQSFINPQQNRSAEIVHDFKMLLNDNFRDLATGKTDKIRSVKEFAERLHVHPNYLTNLIKAETGKPASEWIQERTLAEAMALLNNTTLTISEIAFRLGFSDVPHFGKFFKRHAGAAPSAYRHAVAL